MATSPASKATTSRTGSTGAARSGAAPSGAAPSACWASVTIPRTPAACTAAITRHTARIATLADQCETTMFMTVVAAGPLTRRSGQADPFRSKQVEQHPEDDGDHREVVPDEGEGTQRRLEALHRERLGISRRLLHQEDSWQRPGPHAQDLQPDHGAQPAHQDHRVEAGEHAGKT